MKKKLEDSRFFWNTAYEYLNRELPDIRQKNANTIKAYRDSLNQFIDYLETGQGIRRSKISFKDFKRDNIRAFVSWMYKVQHKAPKTINLRLTAIHSLLKFASDEDRDITPAYVDAKTVKGVTVPKKEIEYFEQSQTKALLSCQIMNRKTERRNRMALILMYDSACRVDEVARLQVASLHLKAETPYVTLCGKGDKYRNVPLMDKTCDHLWKYLKEFHPSGDQDAPLFYAITHGNIHKLSSDTYESMLKHYAKVCEENGAKMPCHVHTHMLRKSRAVDLYQEGMSLAHIQELLGHEHISTTSGFYAFATLSALSKSLEQASGKMDDEGWITDEDLEKLLRL